MAVASQIGKQETVENVNSWGNLVRPWHEDQGTFGKINVLRAGKMRRERALSPIGSEAKKQESGAQYMTLYNGRRYLGTGSKTISIHDKNRSMMTLLHLVRNLRPA